MSGWQEILARMAPIAMDSVQFANPAGSSIGYVKSHRFRVIS
jgi:hypothetical protein